MITTNYSYESSASSCMRLWERIQERTAGLMARPAIQQVKKRKVTFKDRFQAIKYLKLGKTIPETAKLVDVSEQQVREWLVDAGLKKTSCYVEVREHRANTYH